MMYLPVMRANTSIMYVPHVEQRDSSPRIWRQIAVPPSYDLKDLHEILQIAVGWHNYHLHLFNVADKTFSSDRDIEGASPGSITVSTAFRRSPAGIEYIYDFGDDWVHDITLDRKIKSDYDNHPPLCLGGEMACPPEDCGGISGYERMLDIVRDIHHEERDEMLSWLGDFDPECFSVRQASAGLIGWWRRDLLLQAAINRHANRLLKELTTAWR